MAFNVPNTFAAGEDAEASELNANFAKIESELNAFPADGTIKDGAIQDAHIQDGVITTAKLADLSTDSNLSESDTVISSSKAVKDYIDNAFTKALWAITGYLTSNHYNSSYATKPVTVFGNWDYDSDDYYFTVPEAGTYRLLLVVRGHKLPSQSCMAKLIDYDTSTVLLEVDSGGDGVTSNYAYVVANGGSASKALSLGQKICLQVKSGHTVTGVDTQFSLIRTSA